MKRNSKITESEINLYLDWILPIEVNMADTTCYEIDASDLTNILLIQQLGQKNNWNQGRERMVKFVNVSKCVDAPQMNPIPKFLATSFKGEM